MSLMSTRDNSELTGACESCFDGASIAAGADAAQPMKPDESLKLNLCTTRTQSVNLVELTSMSMKVAGNLLSVTAGF